MDTIDDKLNYLVENGGGGESTHNNRLLIRECKSLAVAKQGATKNWSFNCEIGDIVALRSGVYGSLSIQSGFEQFANAGHICFGIATDNTISGTVTGLASSCDASAISFIQPKTPIVYIKSIGMSNTNLEKDAFVFLSADWGDNLLRCTNAINIDMYVIDNGSTVYQFGKMAIGQIMDNNNFLNYNYGNYGEDPTGFGFLLSTKKPLNP